ncbi:hypothetical protein Hanom_Chr15g01340171 [Helianthus anomalus]
MKFKELFESFTGHRSDKRTTGKPYGSNRSEEMKNQERGFESPSPTGPKLSATPSC